MARRRGSATSELSSDPPRQQELGSMYDYLAKVILLGPSGAGKSCLLHRFVQNEWRVLSSQTIGVEFASKVVKVGTGAQRKRVKLQLWDTAGTERFRSVSRSYYRGAAGAILVYDVASQASFEALPTFLMDARALASPGLVLILAGNKSDLAVAPEGDGEGVSNPTPTPSSFSSRHSTSLLDSSASTRSRSSTLTLPANPKATATQPSPQVHTIVPHSTVSSWAMKSNISVLVEVSALTGDSVEELFSRLATMILTKIELGEIDPDDPLSGIQYGDGGGEYEYDDVTRGRRKRGGRDRSGNGWGEVFGFTSSRFRARRRRGGCC